MQFMSNELFQRIGSMSSELTAGKPGETNVLTAAESAWKNPNLELHSSPINSIQVVERTIMGSDLAKRLAQAKGGVVNTALPLALALHQVAPSIVWVATHASSQTQRYALMAGNPRAPDLYVAGGNMIGGNETDVSPFFVPGEIQNLLGAGLTLKQIMENQALMLEQAVSAAYLREISKEAACVGDKALTSESGHTFAALLAGAVYDGRSAVNRHVNQVMRIGTGLDPHTPHNVTNTNASRLQYDRAGAIARVSGYQTPQLLRTSAPLLGSAQIIPHQGIAALGWEVGIHSRMVSYQDAMPRLPIAHVVGLDHAATGAAAIYATEHLDKGQISRFTS